MRALHAVSFLLLSFLLVGCRKGSESKPAEDGDASEGSGHVSSDAHGKHADEVTLSPEAAKRNPIDVATAAKQVLSPSLLAPARVAFNAEALAHVGSQLKGRIASVNVRVGDEVKKGDVLFVIESPELGEAQSDYLLKRALTRSTSPAVSIAQNTYDRAKELHERSQGIALTEVQRREAELRASQAALSAAEAAERVSRERLHLLRMSPESVTQLEQTSTLSPQMTIVAPINGQILERSATLGELVGPERESLLVIADMTRLWVIADVAEARLRDLELGAAARVLLGSTQDHWCQGAVSFISPALNVATRTVPVRIEPKDRHPELRPGVFAQVEIALKPAPGAADPVVAVPEEAIQTVEGEPSLFVPVAGEERTYARRRVVLGRAVGGVVPIVAGLREGETFVARGSFILKAELGKSGAEHDH
ncbi:MAG: efflux RND transporter periplasmic adaptor subunit [Planctomycetes bacterium]|nr:efflux RND transporter periplasmic adaptor subunit [Planctomycetota bacterium]